MKVSRYFTAPAMLPGFIDKAADRYRIFQGVQITLIVSIPVILLTEQLYFPNIGYANIVKILAVLLSVTIAALAAYLNVLHQHKLTEQALQRLQSVAEVVRAQTALRERDIRIQQIFETALDAVVVIDEEGIILEWNPQAENTFGWRRSEIIGQRLAETIIPAEHRGAHGIGFRRFLKTGESSLLNRLIEITALHRDGHIFPIELSIAPHAEGGHYTFSAFIRDISERRNVEERLRQSQKMEAIGHLAAGVSHDFNNELSLIMGYTENVLMKLDKSDPLRKSLLQVERAGERAAGLTHQLLAFSRKQVLQPKVLNIAAIVADMEKMLKRLIGADVELVIEGKEPQFVKVDPNQVEQVIMNLAINARDAMPRGGTLTFETTKVALDQSYAREHPDVVPGPYVMITASDTGMGMDKETISHVFEPFFTTKEQGKGTGLGLATIHGIVRQSGGHITVYSEPGQGTTFNIYFPEAQDAEQIIKKPSEANIVVAPAGSETILFVEDEDAIREMAIECLQEKGYRILEASNGEKALELFERHKDAIQLIVTDVVMPSMRGDEFVDSALKIHPGVKALYMSGYAEHAIMHRGIVNKEAAFLQKPITPSVLLRKVREVLDSSQH